MGIFDFPYPYMAWSQRWTLLLSLLSLLLQCWSLLDGHALQKRGYIDLNKHRASFLSFKLNFFANFLSSFHTNKWHPPLNSQNCPPLPIHVHDHSTFIWILIRCILCKWTAAVFMNHRMVATLVKTKVKLLTCISMCCKMARCIFMHSEPSLISCAFACMCHCDWERWSQGFLLQSDCIDE